MILISSLRSKIILSVSAILAVIIGIGTWINIRYQQGQMESALEDNVLIISNTIEKSLSNAMVAGKSREVQHILEAVGGYHNIRGLRIFSPNGVILKASKRGQIGRRIDGATQKWFLEGKFKRPIKRREEGIFSVLFPIENSEQCYSCHGSTVKLNGVLAVDVSMTQTQEKVGELSKTMILWAFGITATLAISLSLFLTRYVTTPIQELIDTMERAERGLEARAQVKSKDDIGRLAEAFNSLLTKLERARRRVERYHYEQMKRADRLASIGEMAAGIAHEIKNPLAGIAGVIQVLKGDIPIGDPKRAVLDEVLSQVERMDKAVRNLLSFARPPEPKMTLVDVNELLSRLLDFLAPQFAKHGITSERKMTAGLPWLVLDPDLMQQALLNIALNAIKAMPQGGRFIVETNVDVTKDGGGAIRIGLSDSGEGINQENLGRIFSPFFTTRQQGTGLGLSITQRIVEQHNGEISVQSAPGKGSVFTIVLPSPNKQESVTGSI
ncbi:MAG: ATP-binding protein [Nitrospirota bacterium]|nr:ATP-binding protein [Nitrospirota bacterium]